MIYLKNIGFWCIKHICIVLAVIAGLWLWEQWRAYNKESTVSKTEIVPQIKEVKEIHHYHEVANTQPITIHNQITLDSTFRKQMEKEPINTGVKYQDGKLETQTVNPNGQVIQKDYSIPEGAKVTIDNQGVNIQKASFLSQLKMYAGAGTAMNQNGFTELAPKILIVAPNDVALSGGYNFLDNSKEIVVYKKFGFKRK